MVRAKVFTQLSARTTADTKESIWQKPPASTRLLAKVAAESGLPLREPAPAKPTEKHQALRGPMPGLQVNPRLNPS